jgi:hypothetical protein
MATTVPDPEIRKALRRASNFDVLEEHLIREIHDYGELYRIKNPYDTVLLFSKTIQNEFERFDQYLSMQEFVFRENLEKYKDVKNRILSKSASLIQQHLITYLSNKKNAATGIVDLLFEEKNEEKRKIILSDFLSKTEILHRMEKCQKETATVIQEQIQEFFKEFSSQLRDIRIEAQHSAVASRTTDWMDQIHDMADTGDTLEGLGVGASVVFGLGSAVVLAEGAIVGAAGTLFGIGSSQIWNPVGWGLLALSVGLGIWGWRKKSQMEEKIVQAKKQTIVDLKTGIDKVRDDLQGSFRKWVDEIINAIEKEHIGVMERYVRKLIRTLENTRRNASFCKFESMLSRLAKEKLFCVTGVVETEKNIHLELQLGGKLDLSSFAPLLSRVEEKHVQIVTKGIS